MACDSQETVHGYFDGELDAARAAEFERHLQSCAECRSGLEKIKSLSVRLGAVDLSERASPQLRERVQKQIGIPSNAQSTSAWRWLFAPALALVVVGAVFWLALALVQPHTNSARISAELIDAHVRSLQPGHLTDVLSTDQHTVKPWFDGKLDFIPPVEDFAEQGFPLEGGRLDVVDGHTVAALVYGRRKHTINLFVWPERGLSAVSDSSGSRQGYNWLLWKSNDMHLCLVSDASLDDLRELRGLIHP